MATATETQIRGASVGIFDRVSAFIGEMSDLTAKYRVYRETLRELNELTDRDLNDLGISRSAIADVAHEAAFGK